MNEDQFIANGMNGDSGRPVLPPLPAADLGRLVLGLKPDTELAKIVEEYLAGVEEKDPHRAPKLKFDDPCDLAETGWGVMFAKGTPIEVRRALSPLLDRRREQAGSKFYELDPPESNARPPRVLNPERFPYYVLFVGSPRDLSFEQQTRHDVQYAVGRLFFSQEVGAAPDPTAASDAPEVHDVDAYRRYAQGVVDAEDQPARGNLSLFGVRRDGDRATERMADELLAPLAKNLDGRPGWRIRSILGEEAKKDCLRELLGGRDTPDLLLTASHGMVFPSGDVRQVAQQGALLCQDWPGSPELVRREHYFTADDLVSAPRLRGLIAFHLACCSLGTPEHDSFELGALGPGRRVAPRPFVSRLPQRLLAAGARAVVGHVDRAWTATFNWVDPGRPSEAYIGIFEQLMEGMPVGYALEFLDHYGASLTRELNQLRNRHLRGNEVDPAHFGGLWCAVEDAERFQILGDPAVRLEL